MLHKLIKNKRKIYTNKSFFPSTFPSYDITAIQLVSSILDQHDYDDPGPTTTETSSLPEKPRYKRIISKRRGYELGRIIDNVFKVRVELIMVK